MTFIFRSNSPVFYGTQAYPNTNAFAPKSEQFMTILVLDLGSSSVRALLFDDEATLLAQVSRPHRFAAAPPGASTIGIDELEENVEACIDEILLNPQAVNIRAVGMDTFVGNLLGVDAQGRALTPVYTYADTRSAEDVAELAGKLDLEAAHQR